MSGQLRKEESPGRGLQRVCEWHVKKGLASLNATDQLDAVHDVRKEVKKMRSLFRLARGTLTKKQYRKTAETMRLAAKPLAAARDACVTKKALKLLTGRRSSEFPAIQSSLEVYLSHAERNFENNDLGDLTQLVLKRVQKELCSISVRETGWDDVCRRLKASYERGREEFQQAMVKPSPENLHNWRKRVKDLWYQLDFLCPDWPGHSKALLDALEQLGEELGDDHDLVLLGHFIQEHCDDSKGTKKLQDLIDAKRRSYGAGIRRLGVRIYAETPDKVCAKLEQDWKCWRKGK